MNSNTTTIAFRSCKNGHTAMSMRGTACGWGSSPSDYLVLVNGHATAVLWKCGHRWSLRPVGRNTARGFESIPRATTWPTLNKAKQALRAAMATQCKQS